MLARRAVTSPRRDHHYDPAPTPGQENEMAKLEVSDIARSIKVRTGGGGAAQGPRGSARRARPSKGRAEPPRRRSPRSRRQQAPSPAAGHAAPDGASAKGQPTGAERQRPRAKG